jgi:hypothetical protein
MAIQRQVDWGKLSSGNNARQIKTSLESKGLLPSQPYKTTERRLTAYMSNMEYKGIKDVAEAYGVPISYLVRIVLNNYVLTCMAESDTYCYIKDNNLPSEIEHEGT